MPFGSRASLSSRIGPFCPDEPGRGTVEPAHEIAATREHVVLAGSADVATRVGARLVMAAHSDSWLCCASRTNPTARSRTSGANLLYLANVSHSSNFRSLWETRGDSNHAPRGRSIFRAVPCARSFR